MLFHTELFPFRSGFVGVDIFFVISGYLIGGIILAGHRSGCFSIASFYARRARRILPALLLVLAVTVLIGAALLSATEFIQLGKTLAAVVGGIPNIGFWLRVEYFSPRAWWNPLLMTWSLGVEEQFYLCFPWLIYLLARRPRHIVVVFLAILTASSFAFSLWCSWHAPSAAFYLLPARAWELGAGALLAALRPDSDLPTGRPAGVAREALGWGGLAFVGYGVVSFTDQTPFPGWAALVPVLGSAALISSEGSVVNRRLLAARPMVFVGLVSYSWYLWHWPLMAYVRVSSALAPPAWSLVAAGGFAFVLACLSWRFVEQPLRKPVQQPGPILVRYASAIGGAMAVTALIVAFQGWPQRLPAESEQIDQAVFRFYRAPCLASWGQEEPDRSPACVAGKPTAPVIALIGDSHAAHLEPGMRDLAEKSGWGTQVLTKVSCRPLLGVVVSRRDNPGFAAECATFMRSAFESVVEDPMVKIVVLAGLWSGPLRDPNNERYASTGAATGRGLDLLHTGLSNAIATLTGRGKHVVLIGDTPLWRFDPAKVALSSVIPLRRALAEFVRGESDTSGTGLDGIFMPVAGVDRVLQAVSTGEGARYLELLPRFCGPQRCWFKEGATLLFIDHSHLSATGSKRALENSGILALPLTDSPLRQ